MSVQTVNASITNQTTALLDALSLHVLVELTSDCTASNSMLGECPPKITVRRCDDVDKLYEVQVDAFAVPVIFVNRVGAHDLIRRSLETVYVGTLVDTLERKYAARLDDAAQGITHVVRGEDLADNTPRQILLQQALQQRGIAVGGFNKQLGLAALQRQRL